MPSLIKPHDVRVVTKDGEVQVSIVLDLNINLNANGGFSVTAKTTSGGQQEKEDTRWEIPDFTSSPKINFGKKEQ